MTDSANFTSSSDFTDSANLTNLDSSAKLANLNGLANLNKKNRQVSILTSEVRNWIDLQISKNSQKSHKTEIGLCLTRFKSDVVIDCSEELLPDMLVNVNDKILRISDIRKKCHEGCALSFEDCSLAGCYVFAVVEGKFVEEKSVKKS